MFLKFQPRKAIHAASVLARQEANSTITRLRLLKLLYIADRRMIERKGRPLFRARASALDNGPLHSPVYHLIQGESLETPEWDKHFRCEGPRNIVMHNEPAPASLSEYEIKLLVEVSKDYADFDDYELVTETHKFAEYRDSYVPGTSKPIPIEAIIKAVGRESETARILADIDAAQQMDKLLETA